MDYPASHAAIDACYCVGYAYMYCLLLFGLSPVRNIHTVEHVLLASCFIVGVILVIVFINLEIMRIVMRWFAARGHTGRLNTYNIINGLHVAALACLAFMQIVQAFLIYMYHWKLSMTSISLITFTPLALLFVYMLDIYFTSLAEQKRFAKKMSV
jgi:hypothetical protein